MSEQKLQRSLRAHGFELVRQRKHRVYKNPAGQTFVISSTPSDQRWSTYALADLARLCGPAETNPRPLRARRQHGRLDSEPRRAAVTIDSPVEKCEAQPTPAPATPALSRADRQRLKRWEKHESQRGAKDRRLAKLRDLAHRAHGSLEKHTRRSAVVHRCMLIVRLTEDTYRRVRQLGFQDVALAAADVSKDGVREGFAIYVRVGGRFIDILDGVLREGQTWTDDYATVDVWADLQPGDFAEFDGEEMYIGSRCVNPSTFRLELRIPDGQAAEYALFTALLSYAEGMPAVIILSDGSLLHGSETMEAGASMPEGTKIDCRVIRLTAGDSDEIVRAFNDGDWPEMLEAGRLNCMDHGETDESYVEWLKYEIAKREDATQAA